jgi:hypothetical protein
VVPSQLESTYKIPGSDEQRLVEIDFEIINSRCKERSLVAIYVAVMDYFAELEASTAWLSKSGQDIQYAGPIDDYCQRHFSSSPKWIWLHRDPRDVALSSRKAPIGPKHPYACARRWNLLNSLCQGYSINHPDKMVRVGYEQFVRNPEVSLGEICDFLEIKFNSQMLEFHTSRDARRAASTSPLWGNLDKPISADSVRKFEKELCIYDCRIIENTAAPMMDYLKYDRVVHLGDQTPYGEEEIHQFEHEDQVQQLEAQERIPVEELRARSRQWSLLDEISSRNGSSK